MIKNDRQLTIAERKRDDALREANDRTGTDAEIYNALAEDLESQIREYRAIRDGYMRSFEAHSMDELGKALVKSRIARGCTQRQVAEAVDLKEQQVQRYEKTDYESAALWRLSEVIDALGYKLHAILQPKSEEPGGRLEDPRLGLSAVDGPRSSVNKVSGALQESVAS